jgi:hypothetical protein
MNPVPFEKIALEAGVTTRTIARDIARGLLSTRKLDGKVVIDAEAADTVAYVERRRASKAFRKGGKS